MKSLFKIIALVFALLFVWAAYVQNNDPDATMWYFIYGLAALVSVLFFFGRLRFMIAFNLSLAYILGGFISWPEKFEGFTIGQGDIDNIERGREACGLLIVAAVLLMYALRSRYVKKLKV